MEKAATDIYSFRKLRENGFTYVDKTAIILPLCDMSIGSQFFMARPRRFGKSLLVSTLHCLFEGRRELFHGLAIEPKWDWSKSWPVIHLDMGSCQAETVEALKDKMRIMLLKEATRLGVELRDEDPSNAFSLMIDDLAAKSKDGQIVLLVDEYDKPLLGHLSRPDVTQFRDALKEFYSVIKTLDEKQSFTFLTGVSKFSKVSIFSDLNNLKDRTMTASEATLLGYTHDELKRFFPESLKRIAAANGLSDDEAFAEVIKWYDGYRFEETAEKVINPVSFGLCAEAGRFRNYWSTTAMTTFLTAIGFGVDAEVLTNEGRIDMTCETPAGIWLVDRPAEEALAQIDAMNYAEKYDFSGKKVRKIGISFSSEKCTIGDWTAR